MCLAEYNGTANLAASPRSTAGQDLPGHDRSSGAHHRSFKEDGDIRQDNEVAKTVLARLKEHDVRSFVMLDKIFG